MQKLMKAMHKNEKGFTLVELMVVVVIIGILVAIAIPIYSLIVQRAERSTIEANVRIIDGAIGMKIADGQTVAAQTTTVGVNTELADYLEPVQLVGAEIYGIQLPADTEPGGPRAIVTPSTALEGGIPAGTYTLAELLLLN